MKCHARSSRDTAHSFLHNNRIRHSNNDSEHAVKFIHLTLPLCNNNSYNPNTIKFYKILQKLSPKHAVHGVAQSTYPRHGKACLSKQFPLACSWDPRLARGRSRVRAPGPAGALRALFFSTLPSFLLREIIFFRTFPTNPAKVLGLLYTTG